MIFQLYTWWHTSVIPHDSGEYGNRTMYLSLIFRQLIENGAVLLIYTVCTFFILNTHQWYVLVWSVLITFNDISVISISNAMCDPTFLVLLPSLQKCKNFPYRFGRQSRKREEKADTGTKVYDRDAKQLLPAWLEVHPGCRTSRRQIIQASSSCSSSRQAVWSPRSTRPSRRCDWLLPSSNSALNIPASIK